MNTATAILRQEHDAILRMLDVTDAIVQQLERNQRVAPETLAGVLEFFRLFADRCHHGKEEELLFPLLERKGMAHDGGPIGVMLHEHEQGRSLVRQLGEAADACSTGMPGAG
ncbi:MAG: hemerythrin domain-containing protein, partial [Candidatus Acidiferrales bacterium]